MRKATIGDHIKVWYHGDFRIGIVTEITLTDYPYSKYRVEFLHSMRDNISWAYVLDVEILKVISQNEAETEILYIRDLYR